jgi:hypothetical protein
MRGTIFVPSRLGPTLGGWSAPSTAGTARSLLLLPTGIAVCQTGPESEESVNRIHDHETMA